MKTNDVLLLRNLLQIPLFRSEQWKNNTGFGQRAEKHTSQIETPITCNKHSHWFGYKGITKNNSLNNRNRNISKVSVPALNRTC